MSNQREEVRIPLKLRGTDPLAGLIVPRLPADWTETQLAEIEYLIQVEIGYLGRSDAGERAMELACVRGPP